MNTSRPNGTPLDYAYLDERSMHLELRPDPEVKRHIIYRLAVKFYRFMTVPQPF